MARAWHTLKTTLEYVHLTYFVLHLAHGDTLALLTLVITSHFGWITIAALGAAYLLVRRRDTRREVLQMSEPQLVPENDQPSTKPEPELTITTPNVPHTLAQLARAGVHVKITIDLNPSPRRRR